MRVTRSITPVLLIALAACSSLTAPPNGLPVTVAAINLQDFQGPSITGAGDSVVAMVRQSASAACGDQFTAAAGLRAGELVITLTQSQSTRQCPPGVTGVLLSPLEIVVHQVPSGTRPATVVWRLVSGNNATYTTLASGTVSVP